MKGTLLLYSMNVCYSVQQSEQTVHFSALTKKAGLDKSCFIFTTVLMKVTRVYKIVKLMKQAVEISHSRIL